MWLAGNTFYGTRQIFEPAFLEWLENDFRLSEYEVSGGDGQLVLRFSGLWTEVTMWEVYALALVSEMKTRAALEDAERAGAGCAVCAGEDEAVGQD
jgi:nicotinate phosphoribosyltransferase